MLKAEINGIALELDTHPTLFSPGGIDAGTRLLLRETRFHDDDKVLDLGCGYGVVGIVAARTIGADRVTLLDVDPTAVAISRENLVRNGVAAAQVVESDGFRDLDDAGYTLILSNPPYHADFAVPRHFIEKGFNRLVIGGRMLMVTRRRDWYRNKLRAIFGNVTERSADGYTVFIAVKRSPTRANVRKRARQTR